MNNKIVNQVPVFLACIFVVNIHKTKSMFEETTEYEKGARENLFHDKFITSISGEKTVFVALFVRNKEHTLPYFLKGLEDLKYNKSLIRLWIVSDHNKDNSILQLKSWIDAFQEQYSKIELETPDFPNEYVEQKSDIDWTNERFYRLLKLRQTALNKARELKFDCILYIDADNILMNPYSLNYLTEIDVTIVAPMLDSASSYSNFWGAMNEKGYYGESDLYDELINNRKHGTFPVPMVHSTFLINLGSKKSKKVRFLPIPPCYNNEFDDIIIFAYQCKLQNVAMNIDNSVYYGYIVKPMDYENSLEDEVDNFLQARMKVMTIPPIGIGISFHKSVYVPEREIPPTKLGFDDIFIINLKRKPDRRLRMKKCLQMQGIEHTMFDAIDGRNLNTTYLTELGVKMLPGYVDPYNDRPLTMGEIGCFLSHYFIWKEIFDKNYESALIFEDDVNFKPKFRQKLLRLREDIKAKNISWDLIYVGRKIMDDEDEPVVMEGFDGIELVKATYSYWAIGYMLSRSGVRKLIEAEPLGKMIPVDELLPLMHQKHPIAQYNEQFSNKNLIGLAFKPVLLRPTHFSDDVNHSSDTEGSEAWRDANAGSGKSTE